MVVVLLAGPPPAVKLRHTFQTQEPDYLGGLVAQRAFLEPAVWPPWFCKRAADLSVALPGNAGTAQERFVNVFGLAKLSTQNAEPWVDALSIWLKEALLLRESQS